MDVAQTELNSLAEKDKGSRSLWVKAKEVSGAVAGIERLGSRQSPLSRFPLLLGNEAHTHSALPTQWREREEETFRPSLRVHRSFDTSRGPLR